MCGSDSGALAPPVLAAVASVSLSLPTARVFVGKPDVAFFVVSRASNA